MKKTLFLLLIPCLLSAQPITGRTSGILNVMQGGFGCVGNGVADDAPCINRAITFARTAFRAQAVYLPGNYVFNINSTVFGKDGVVLYGDGPLGGLKTSLNITMFSTNGLADVTVRNLRFTGPAMGTAIGIDVNTNSHHAVIQDCHFTLLNKGIMVQWDSAELDNNYFYQVNYPMELTTTAHSTNILAPRIDTAVRGLQIATTGAVRNVTVTGGTLQNCSDIGIWTSPNSMDIVLTNQYAESNANSDLFLQGKNIKVVGFATSSIGGTSNIHGANLNGIVIESPHFQANPTAFCIAMESTVSGLKVSYPLFDAGIAAAKYYSLALTNFYIIEPSGTYYGSKALSDAADVGLFEVALPNGSITGGFLSYTVNCTDGVDYQGHSGVVTWAAVNKGGAITATIGESAPASGLENVAVSAGSLTDSWTILAGVGKITIRANFNTSLAAPTSFFILFRVSLNDTTHAATIL